MTFSISPAFIRSQQRNIQIFAVVLVLLGIGALYLGYKNNQYQMYIFAPMMFWLAWHKYQHLAYWRDEAGHIRLTLTDTELQVSQGDNLRTTLLTDIDRLTLQRKFRNIDSILVHHRFGQVQRLRGFTEMDTLASTLAAVVGSDKVRTSYILHK